MYDRAGHGAWQFHASKELKNEEEQGRADLHMHSVYSDGILQPEALFKKAKIAGLKAISITDHDNVEACIESHTLKTKYNIDFINGIELSCFEDREYHILGYNIDIEWSGITAERSVDGGFT